MLEKKSIKLNSKQNQLFVCVGGGGGVARWIEFSFNNPEAIQCTNQHQRRR